MDLNSTSERAREVTTSHPRTDAFPRVSFSLFGGREHDDEEASVRARPRYHTVIPERYSTPPGSQGKSAGVERNRLLRKRYQGQAARWCGDKVTSEVILGEPPSPSLCDRSSSAFLGRASSPWGSHRKHSSNSTGAMLSPSCAK